MNSMTRERNADRLSLLDRWREIETPAMWFILMNVLDAALIYILLNTPARNETGPVGVESNQIALYFLNRWGIKGLFSFKLASAAFVCAIAYVVTFKSVDTARRLLAFGTLIVMVVVVYSVLVARHIIHGVNLWPLG
jgi:hypothetical protein